MDNVFLFAKSNIFRYDGGAGLNIKGFFLSQNDVMDVLQYYSTWGCMPLSHEFLYNQG